MFVISNFENSELNEFNNYRLVKIEILKCKKYKNKEKPNLSIMTKSITCI